ncbi:DGQHR domain-containing protein [Stenotrophomonas geniculata]|uniref:DGQHR domain-containing protein n=1 Tax=Stenotrophomonas geniculata TaxID=86188 RepID=UPI002E791E6F|nr:DGQHR domain-containing protein [Stenotrophomonas geniculata]
MRYCSTSAIRGRDVAKGAKQPSDAAIWPLLDKDVDLRKEFRLRSKKFDQKRVISDEIAHNLDNGWIIHKKEKGKASLRKDKCLDERVENIWWTLLYKMGYRELNSGRNFRILTKKRKEEVVERPFSVFAADDETVIVTRVKTSERLKRASVSKELADFASCKGEVATAVKNFYSGFKPKILWFYLTENIVWSESDIEFAAKQNIKRVTEQELPYFTQIAELLGKAARFQFLAEFLKDQPIPEMTGVTVSATRSKLGGRYFYSFVSTPRQLLKISFVNHRTLDDPEGHPTYQRLVQKSRLKSIASYILNGGIFPNNLLINFSKPPRFDITNKDTGTEVHFGTLYLPNTYKSAWIIDGQHRLYGYASLPDPYLDQRLVVVAFEGISKEDEAEMFVTINHEQKSVPKNLLDDLEGQLKWGSDNPGERIGALAARAIQTMNKDPSSPLHARFSAEGIKGSNRACLTVPQVKIGLKRSGIFGTAQKGDYLPGPLGTGTDNATLQRGTKVLNGFLRQFQEADVARWEIGRTGKLCTNDSIQALSLLLGEITRHLQKSGQLKVKASDTDLLEKVTDFAAPLLDYIKDSAPDKVDATLSAGYGSGAPRTLFLRFSQILRQKHHSFCPDGLEDWEKTQSEELKNIADQQVQQINILAIDHIFRVFRAKFGEENNNYWEKGIVQGKIKTSAYSKSQDVEVGARLPLEAYLDFIDLKQIIEEKTRWPLFKDVMDIPLDGQKGNAKNVKWMDRFNEIRRIPAHAAPGRGYSLDDLDLLELVANTLQSRISAYDYDQIQPED